MTKRKKLLIIIFSVVGLILGAVGGIGAYILIQGNKPQAVLEDEEAQYTTTLKEAPTDGSLPIEHSATDVIAYTLYYVANSNQFKVTTKGTAKASVATQTIANERIVKDGTAMVSTISSGMVSVATQRYFFTEAENKTLTRGASKINKTSAVWDDSEIPECITYNAMKKRYGWLPFQANGYIICDETFLDITAITLTDNGDGTYTIVFDLDPDGDKAPFWYRREIIQSSGSTIVPVFSKIHMEFTIDKNYRLLKQDIQESYRVKSMGVEAQTVTDCHDTFEYDDVQYNDDYLSYFMKYKSLEPAEDDDSDNNLTSQEDDITTMVVSALQGDGSDLGLDVTGNFGDIKLDIDAVLNISDLLNVKVLAEINDRIYIEYNNFYLYLSINDSIKYKAAFGDMYKAEFPDDYEYESLINSDASSDDSSSSLDVNAILASLNGGTVTKNDNNILIDTTLTISDISLDLHFDLNKTDDGYELNSITASGNILGNELNINAIKTNNLIQAMDHSDFILFNFQRLANNLTQIIEDRLLKLDLTVSLGTALVNLDLTADFNNGIYAYGTVNVKYETVDLTFDIKYDNGTIYFNYDELYLSFTIDELMELINGDSTSTKVESTNDSSTELDFNLILSIIESISKADTTSIFNDLMNLDLSSVEALISDTSKAYDDIIGSLLEGLTKLDLVVSNNYTSFDFNYNKVGISLSFSVPESVDHSFDSTPYIDVINYINEGRLEIDAEITFNSLSIKINGSIDFNDPIYLNANVIITYKEDIIELNLIYSNDIIYLNYENLYASISVNELKNIINKSSNNTSTTSLKDIVYIINNLTAKDIDNIIDSLLNLDFSVLDNIIDKTETAESPVASMINLLNKIKLINNDNKNETFISYNNLSLKAIASCPDTINKEFDDTIYISLDSLINDIYNAYEALNNNSFRINLEAELNLKDLANIDKDVLLNGYIDFILNDNNQYNIKADLDIYALDIKTDISVIIIDNKIYLEVAGVNIMVLESDLDSLITDIKVALGLDNADNNTSLITKTQVFDILESLTLLSENKFSIDLTAVYEKLGVLTIALIESDDLLEAELNVNFLSASVDINTIDSYLVEEPTEYLDRNDIVNACEMVKSVLDISKEKEFNITLALNVYDDEILHLNAVGDILFKIYDNGRFDFGADLVLTEYDTDGISVKMVHYININLLSHEYFEALGTDSEDMLYITYGTNPDDLTSLIKMYTPANDILDLTATFTTLLGVDLSFLDGYSTFNFNDIDTSLLKDLFISDVEENTDKYSYKYDLSKFINSLNLDENKLTLDLDLSSALKSNNKNTVIVLDLNESDTNKAAVSLKDLYINNTKLSADLVLLKDSVTIEAPTIDSSWVDISTVDDLVAGLLTTASKKSFEIEGTITLSVLSLNAIDVPVIAKVLVYDDGSFELYIRLDYDKTTLVSLFGLIDNDYTEFYYKDGFIIEKASGDDLVEVKVSTETFFNNIIYYIFDLGMGMSDSIISQIEGSDSGDSSDDIIDAGVVLNSYTSDGTTFDISLNLGELISNSSIGNLDITFGSQEVVIKEDENGIETANALTTISKLSLDLYTAIDIALSDSLRLTNLETDSDGYTRLIAIDMTDIDNYINSYSYKTGYIYTNGSATSRISCNVTFVSDYKDNITESYTVESDITYPYSVLENNGVKYVVEGWYLDPEFTEKFTSTVMPGYNITLYAKLIEISGTYKLYIDGNYYMDFDTDTILNLTDNYSIYDDGIYYTYAGSDITSEFIFSKYFDLFDSDGTDLYFNLVTYQNERDGYYNIELNYSNSFTNKKYIAITLPNDLVFTYDYLNVGTYSVYDVNFWYDSNYDIYNDETAKLINYNTTLSAYYSVSNVLGYTIVDDKLYVSSYSYLGDDSINLIFPKYVLINDSYYTPYGISGTPFSGKTNISNVYLNDGLVIISSGAFGEATSIVDVYFGNTFSTLIANDGGRFDSFYMGDSSKMNSITFYLAEESTVDISAWYCYKSWLFGYSYHNYDSSRFSYYNGSINSYVNSIF